MYTLDENFGFEMPRAETLIWSIGPDLTQQLTLEEYLKRAPQSPPGKRFQDIAYDPTNGASSKGDVILEPNVATETRLPPL